MKVLLKDAIVRHIGCEASRANQIIDKFRTLNPSLKGHIFRDIHTKRTPLVCNVDETTQKILDLAKEMGPNSKPRKSPSNSIAETPINKTTLQVEGKVHVLSNLVRDLQTNIQALRDLGYDVQCTVRAPARDL